MPAATFSLATLDGTNGFLINGVGAFDGFSVGTAGDINGDGFADLIFGSPAATTGGGGNAGTSFVMFGKANGFNASFNVTALDGTNGFRLDGIDTNDQSGSVSSLGDINGDGFDDFIIGASGGDPGGNSAAGESYVVFGKASGFPAVFDLATLDGSNGFRLNGADPGDQSGSSVSAAGDVNGDGFEDIFIGAFHGDPGGNADAGESYVVFGKASGFSASLDLSTLDGSNGFRLDGSTVKDYSGRSVSSAGDINGDGFDDIIIGAFFGDPGGDFNAGESYVVFGKASGFAASLDLSTLDGTNGFRLDGIDPNDASGWSVSGAGDVNNDGFDDFIIGAFRGDPSSITDAGETYVVFGKASGFSASLDLSTLDGTNGFRLDGSTVKDYSGRSVSSAGDFNGDGFADIIISAANGDPGGLVDAGESYVVFGKAGGFAASINLSTLDGATGIRIDGFVTGFHAGEVARSAGDFNGDGFDDVFLEANALGGAAGYVVFGFGAAQAFSFDTIAAGSGVLSGFTSSVDTLTITGSASSVVITEAGDDVILSQNPTITVEGIGAHQFTNTNLLASDGSQFIIGDDNASTSSSGDDQAKLYDNTASITNDLIMGFGGNDTIIGGSGNERLMGGADDDSISGGIGNDTLDGGAGADTLGGDTGTDTASYATSSVGVFATQKFSFLNNGDAAGDSFISIENMLGSAFNDILGGNDSDNDIVGGDGADWLFGFLGADTLQGGIGDDTLNGGAGADSLDGGSGFDFASYKVLGTAGVNASLTTPGSNTGDAAGDTYTSIEGLRGTDFSDMLEGDGAGNKLQGGASDDTLIGGAGADTLFGGIGTDTASYVGAASAVTVDLSNTASNTGDAAGDSYISIENILGSNFSDTLTGDGSDNGLAGGAGADSLNGGSGFDFASYSSSGIALNASLTTPGSNTGDALGDTYTSIEALIGSDFDDTLEGDSAANLLSGALGADTLIGGAGGDTLDGGTGTDTASYASSGAGLWALQKFGFLSNGDALGDSFTSVENMLGSSFNDLLGGNDSANRIDGGAGSGADWLFGFAGSDTLIGGSGNDTLNGGAGADSLDGGADFDFASYNILGTAAVNASLTTPGANTGDAAGDVYTSIEGLSGTNFNDTLEGDGAANTLIGHQSRDMLLGLGGTDSLVGGSGADTLNGGEGADTLDGGLGFDTASYELSAGGVNASLINPGSNTGDAAGDIYTSIESLIGTAFNDTLEGDAGANDLQGGAGNDTLLGGKGNDTLNGGAGADSLDGGAQVDAASYALSTAGVNASLTTPGSNTGDAAGDIYTSIENLIGSAFNDLLEGDGAANELQGGAGDDTLLGGTGGDILIGGEGADSLDGGIGFDNASYELSSAGVNASLTIPGSNTGDAAGDTYSSIEGLKGSDFNDILEGTNGFNSLIGGQGDDILLGLGGKDTFSGGEGDDTLSGGQGDDFFIFSNGDGADTIQDFTVGAASNDLISLNVIGITTFADVQAAATQVGSDTKIDFGGGDSITLIGITATDLHTGDFFLP